MTENMIATLRSADLVVATGSVDGVLTAAAVKRLVGRDDLEVEFTQPFQVNQLPVAEWHERRVVFVDLSVNNRQPEMTAAFVAALRAGGNTLLAIIDEHDADAWHQVLGSSFDDLVITPMGHGGKTDAGSAGGVLCMALNYAGVHFDTHTAALLAAADEADHMDFDSPLANMVNRAVKSKIADNGRRVYLVDLLSGGAEEPDDTVAAWIGEYEQMEANAAELLETAVIDLGDGIVSVDTGGRPVDVTTFLFALYERARVVVLTGTQAYNPVAGRPMPVVTLATGIRMDLLAVVKAVGVQAGGFAQKANIDPDSQALAVAAVRVALRSEA